MKLKKKIKEDILSILIEKEIPQDTIQKILGKLTNYAYTQIPDTCPMFLSSSDLEWAVSVCQSAIKHYGIEAQLEKIKEECSELHEAADAFSKEPAREDIQFGFADELADVYVMTLQGAQMIGVDKVRDRILFKVKRLEGRIAGC